MESLHRTRIHRILTRMSDLEQNLRQMRDELTELLVEGVSGVVPAAPPAVRAGGSSVPAAPHEPAEAPPRLEAAVDLEQWLRERGVTIRQRRPDLPLDPTLDRMARFLGQHHDALRPFYVALKRRIAGAPYPRSVSTSGFRPDQITTFVQFGNDLRRNGFLREFRYDRSNRQAYFDPQDDGRITQFFTGNWLERFVVLKVCERLRAAGISGDPEVLVNPQVTLPDGLEFELDLLVGAGPLQLWLECKTGSDYPAYVSRYGRISRQFLRLPPSRCALVLLEPLTAEEKVNNSALAAMTVLNLTDLDGFLEAALSEREIPLPDPPQPPATTARPLARPSVDYAAALNRMNLRPLTLAQRRRIVLDLHAVAAAAPEPLPLNDVTRQVKAQYDAAGAGISRSQITDVSNALRHSGACLRGSHPEYPHDVWFLRTELSPEEMLERCSELYVWSLLKEPELQAAHPESVGAIATLLWDEGLSAEAAGQSLARVVEHLIARGRCVLEDVGGHPRARAVGEDLL